MVKLIKNLEGQKHGSTQVVVTLSQIHMTISEIKKDQPKHLYQQCRLEFVKVRCKQVKPNLMTSDQELSRYAKNKLLFFNRNVRNDVFQMAIQSTPIQSWNATSIFRVAVIGKTGKTVVLPRFYRIELGGCSDDSRVASE